MAEIKLENVTLNVSNAPLLQNATITFNRGALTALVGPNGAGKTTLLKAAMGLLAPSAGVVTLNNKPLTDFSPIERARLVSYLPQTRPLAWPITVRNVVALGRYAFGVGPTNLSDEDARAVDNAIAECGLAHLATRQTDTLSGGELARVHCARALAGQTPLLIADEPVASLDPNHQFQIMKLIRRYADQGGGAVIVLHDIELAARFANRLIWMKDGTIIADGPPQETITQERMREIFGVETSISNDRDFLSVSIIGTE